MAHNLKCNEGYDQLFRLKRIDPMTGTNVEINLRGRRHYPKNITIVSDEDFAELIEFEQVSQLMKKLVIQDMSELPNNYYDAMELAQKNTMELALTRSEVEKKETIISEKDAEIERLKKKMKDAGVE